MTDSSTTISKQDKSRLIQVISYLSNKSQSKLKQRSGLLNGARVSYFRGKNALSTDQPPVLADMDLLVELGFLVRVDKLASAVGKYTHLQVSPIQQFEAQEYYVIAYHPTNYMQIGASIGLVFIVLAGIMFPLWPASVRQYVVYLSYFLLFLLGILFVLSIIRLVIFCVGFIVGKPGWLFPNLFADVGILDSFKPVWAWDVPKKSTTGSKVSAADTTTTTTTTSAASDKPKTN